VCWEHDRRSHTPAFERRARQKKSGLREYSRRGAGRAGLNPVTEIGIREYRFERIPIEGVPIIHGMSGNETPSRNRAKQVFAKVYFSIRNFEFSPFSDHVDL